MTRKLYIAFANAVKEISDPQEREKVARTIIEVCKADNPRFDEGRFRQAANI